MATAAELRTLTGVGLTQYTIDDTTYWTDAQLQAVLDDQDGDIHGAAAVVFTAWAAATATAYDVEMDGQSLSRSQMSARLSKLAEQEAGRSASGTDSAQGIKSVPTKSDLGRVPGASGPWPGFDDAPDPESS